VTTTASTRRTSQAARIKRRTLPISGASSGAAAGDGTAIGRASPYSSVIGCAVAGDGGASARSALTP
jgi:hypothetical protein